MVSLKPRRLAGRDYEKIWGSHHLEPWFPDSASQIGEIWFAEEDAAVLIKFLFTTENLSVQVHPNDEQARADGGVRGKTEMWHILRAEPEARIAIGLKQPMADAELRQACLDGSIMDLLLWIPARPGETWFIPAGTIHAIGAGIALCEIQQHSDITYRLYDYGRNRELHLDRGLAVLHAELQPVAIRNNRVDCPYFQVHQISVVSEALSLGVSAGSSLVVTHGSGLLDGAPFRMGEVWSMPSDGTVTLSGEAQVLHINA